MSDSTIESFKFFGTRVRCRLAKIFSAEECKTGTRSKIWTEGAQQCDLRIRIKMDIGTQNAKAKSSNAGTRDAKAFRNARPALMAGTELWSSTLY